MKLSIFSSLYQAKEVLYFYTHFLSKNFLFTCPAEWRCVPLRLKRPSAAENSAVPGRSQEPVWAPQRNNGRFEAVKLPVSAGLPPGGRAAALTPLYI